MPALGGPPIWDDLAYWFYHPGISLSYSEIWTTFLWPLSFSVQKALLGLFGDNFWLYHVLSLALHFLNSFLVFVLAQKLRWSKPRWIFLLFLFHPTCVMAAGWMIQIKTLMCFCFAFSAALLFLKGKPTSVAASFLLFTLSILSKAASLPLLVGAAFNKATWSKRAKLIFAFILVFAAVIALHFISRNSKFEAATVRTSNRAVFSLLSARYYIQQSLFPLNVAPIKGRSPVGFGFSDLAFWIVLAGCVFKFRKKFLYFGFGVIILLPYLGLIKAPFMTMTWVSDQHLYLALPFLLATYLALIEKVPRSDWICAVALAFFVFKTADSARSFASEDRFYQLSLTSDGGNVAVALNYINTLAHQDRTEQALRIASAVLRISERDSHVANNPDLPELIALRKQLVEFEKYRESKKN